jgi:hypothetical protein
MLPASLHPFTRNADPAPIRRRRRVRPDHYGPNAGSDQIPGQGDQPES